MTEKFHRFEGFCTILRFHSKTAESSLRAPGDGLKMCQFMLSDLEDDQADLVNGDAADQTTDGEEAVRKPRKKK